MAVNMIEYFFQRSLDDLVKGLRVQMIGETQYFSRALDEIRKEMKSTDPTTKAVALQKLTSLHMVQGTDMGWASFNVVEVMSMQKFSLKKLGYLAASQSFHEGTDVLLLLPNLMRKDLGGKNEYDAGLVIDCLSRIATPDLARELTPELFAILASGRVYIRKKATLALLRLFVQYPDSIRVVFKRLVEKLDDSNSSVVCAAVSVFCELSIRDPKPYLPLAPEFYRILVGSSNNWLSIKLIKIFGTISPLEPRLGRKIAEPLCDIMRKTSAKSVLLECVQTVTQGLLDHSGSVKLCVEKLRELMAEDDTNLKFLGLRALANLMPAHPWAVADNREVIVKCLNDGDPSIQKGALRLIMGMVSESNVVETVQVLLEYANVTDNSFRNELVSAILSTCSRGQYHLVIDFSWYVSVLAQIAKIPHCEHGEEIGRQMVDISLRVKSVTEDLVKIGRSLLLDPALLSLPSLHEVLAAAAWVAGEYVAFTQNPYELIEALLQPQTKLLSPTVHAVYLHAVFKIFVHFASRHYATNEPKSLGSSKVPMFGPSSKQIEKVLCNSEESFLIEPQLLPIISPGPEKVREVEKTTVDTEERSGYTGNALPRGEEDSILTGGEVASDHVLYTCRDKMNTDKLDKAVMGSVVHQQVVSSDEPCSGESLKDMVQVVMQNVAPLTNNVHVEVQERACNIVGLLQFFEARPGSLLDENSRSQEFCLQDLLKALQGIFSVELGPVSAYAQGRVVAPKGLIFENLDALGPLEKFSAVEGFGKEGGLQEWEDGTLFAPQNKGNSIQSGEGAARLAQHRQRHGSFYLPNDDKLLTNSSDYPPPIIAQASSSSLPLGASSSSINFGDVLSGTKGIRTKVRPVVVKLDDEEELVDFSLKSKRRNLKDDFISSAIRDVLTGDARSGHKYLSTLHGSEGKHPVEVRHHRSRGHRSSHQSHKESKEKDLADSRPDKRSGPLGVVNLTGENNGTSVPERFSGASKSSSKHRHSRHETKKHSDSESEQGDIQALRSPRRRRAKFNSQRAGRQKRTGSAQKLPDSYSVPDSLL